MLNTQGQKRVIIVLNPQDQVKSFCWLSIWGEDGKVREMDTQKYADQKNTEQWIKFRR